MIRGDGGLLALGGEESQNKIYLTWTGLLEGHTAQNPDQINECYREWLLKNPLF